MTPDASIENLFNIDLEGGEFSVSLGSYEKIKDNPDYRSISLGTSLTEEFLAFISNKLDFLKNEYQNNNLTIRNYDLGYKKEKYEIEVVKISENIILRKFFENIPESVDMPLFQLGERSFFNNLRFYVINIELENPGLIRFFKFFTKSRELSTGNRIVATFTRNRFDKLRNVTFSFDSSIDCLEFNGIMYILNKDNFHKIFRFEEEMHSIVENALQTIGQRLPIQNFNDFMNDCLSDNRKIDKIMRFADKEYLNTLTIADIERNVDSHSLNVEIAEHNGEKKINYTKETSWTILKLLDDAYLDSTMTQISYEVNSKIKHQ